MSLININGISDSLTAVGISQLGTAVYDNIFFPSGEWTDVNGNSQFYADLNLDDVTVRVNRRKDIVKTSRAGANGKIKEYISFDDFSIEVTAILTPFLITELGGEPTAKLTAFAKLEKVEQAVDIRSKFLNNTFNITSVVVEEFSLERNSSDSWVLSMSLISDLPIDLGSFG